MSQFNTGNAPGFQSQIEGETAQVWFAGRGGQSLIATRHITIDKDETDTGNSPTTTLDAGNVMALDDTTGKARLYNPDANDGTQIAQGVLEQSQDMLVDGVATDRFTQMLACGLLKESEISGLDARGRSQLAGRFLLDQTPGPVGVLMHPKGVYRKAADYTVTAADNGLLFMSSGAVTFTLPAKENGLAFRFAQTQDENLVIEGNNDIVHKDSHSANTVTFSTASEKIGSQALVECVYLAEGTLRWLVTNLGGTTATVA